MKKIYIVTLGILLVAALIIGGLAKPAPAWDWPKSLTIAVQAQESPMYAISVGWSSVLEKETGMKVRVTFEEIGSLRLRYIGKGRLDTCTEEPAGIRMTMEGIREHATRDGGPFPLRILWPNFLSAQTIMVRGDSDIKTMRDLKPGIKVSVHPGAGPRQTLLGLLAYAGLKEEDVNILEFGSMAASMRSIVDGKTVCCASDPGHPLNIEFEASPHGIRYLNLDPEENPQGAARLLKIQPTSVFGKPVLACKSARGIQAVIHAQLYVASENTDPELAYHLAKWVDENFNAYKGMHPTIACMSINAFRDVLDTACFPIHEGVLKYLKEKGVWTARDDKRQAHNVKLVNRYVAAYKAAIAEADAKGIKVYPKNKDWMNLWAKHKKGIPIFKVMPEIP